MIRQKLLSICGVLCAVFLYSREATAQTYRVLVGYPPGGVQDQQARVFAEKLREATGHPFIAETRAGASGQIAVDELLRSPADGTTLLMTTDSNVAAYPATVRKQTYVPTDFAPVAHAGEYRLAFGVGAAVPVTDLKSFIAWSKGPSGPVGYGTPGAGSIPHFFGVLLGQVTGARVTHIPYKGTGPALTDLAGGHVPAGAIPLGSLLPYAKSGKVRILGQTGETRSPDAPDVATFRELGYAPLAASGWYGLFARAGTPAEVVTRYHEVIAGFLSSPEGVKRMRDWQLEPRALTPAQFMDVVKADTHRWAKIVKASGFTLESE